MNIAIILAAGNSERTNGVNKILYQISKKPLIYYTIQVFENHPEIQRIILVIKKSDFSKFNLFTKKHNFKKIKGITFGGENRQISAFNGLKMAEKSGAKRGDLILFHNGVNPLVSQKEISKVIRGAKEYGAALVAQPLKDSLKKGKKDSFVEKNIPRENLWLAQTPQGIEYNLAKKAFEKAQKDKFYGTDDVSLVERIGGKIKIVSCSHKNFKITFEEDLEIAKKLLKNQNA